MRMLHPWGIGPSILMYHSIADNSDDIFTVTADAVREQISWLYENEFEVVSLSFLLQLVQARDYGSLRKKVVVTFDDGYRDFITNALPILLNHGTPATVFLVTDMLGERGEWNQNGADVQLMSEDEVHYIKEKGISLGSHTATHVNLTLEDQEGLLQQLKDSHDVLTRLGESFYTLSYPWGQWSCQVADSVKSSGYECALAVGEQMRLTAENSYLLPRITMRGDMDLRSFQSLMTRTRVEKEIRRRYRILRETRLGAAINDTFKNRKR